MALPILQTSIFCHSCKVSTPDPAASALAIGARSPFNCKLSVSCNVNVRCLQAANMDANVNTTDLLTAEQTVYGGAAGSSSILGLQAGRLKAVIFDVDGTLCDSDPLHHIAFSESLQKVGFQGGAAISEEFFMEHMSGKDTWEVLGRLFPEWDEDNKNKFVEDKEARFQRLARQNLQSLEGLELVCNWIQERGLHRAAVTNAPRENAELMISILGLSSFFNTIIVGSECSRPKPFPDPYLTALHYFDLAPHQAFVFEDSSTGLRAASSAGIPAIAVGTRTPEAALLSAGACFAIPDYRHPKLWDALRSL